MTVFGPDISSYEAGLDLSRLADASFVIAKCSEGTYYTDSSYQAWRRQASSLRLPFAWYHFLTTENIAAQVAHNKACVGDSSLPGMLDVEPQTQTGSRPTVDQVLEYADQAKAEGLNLRLVYLPRWYWQELGSPPLAGLKSRGLRLVSSAYPGGTGAPQQIYPGDQASGWNAYSGDADPPLLYQFTNQATDGGKSMDYNAFRGSPAQLATYLETAAPTTTTGDTSMGTIPASIGTKWPDIASEFPANAQFDNDNALIWADGGARAAALYAKQARDAAVAMAAKVGALTPMDPAALATQIVADLKTAGLITVADPAAIATAVVTALEQHNLGGLSAQQMGAALTAAASALNAGGA